MSYGVYGQVASLDGRARAQVIRIHSLMFKQSPTPCAPCGGKCCVACASSMGYIADKMRAKALADKYGFFGPNTPEHSGFGGPGGCRLPVEERSLLCVAFTCEKMTAQQRAAGTAISDIANREWQVARVRRHPGGDGMFRKSIVTGNEVEVS